MLDYKQLEALVAVVEEESFDKAGLKLHITQSAVTQRIRQMEEFSGQVLLIRSQPPGLTEKGRLLVEHYRKVHLLEKELTLHPGEVETLPTIALAVNADSLATWFSEVIAAYMKEERGFLDVHSADQDVTHTLLAGGDVMGCISAASSPVRACKTVYLGDMVYRLVCNEEFYEKYFSKGMSAENLHKAPIMNFNRDDGLLKSWIDKVFPQGCKLKGSHFIPSAEQFIQMIIRGNACGMIPDEQYYTNKRKQKLVDLSQDQPVLVPLYWQRWALESGELDHLGQLILNAAKEALE